MADLLTLIFAACAGLLIGSFLNVCIYRIPRDLSVVTPRSFCPECEAPIAAYDNVPLLSFLLLQGRCRLCKAPISFRYPVVEATTATLFVLVVARYGLTGTGLKWLIFEALMVALFWTDWETELLPDEMTLGGTAVGFIFALFVSVPGMLGVFLLSSTNTLVRSLLNAAAGSALLSLPIWLTAFLFSLVVKREALGLGDVKLLLLLGSFLGFEAGLQAVTLGTIVGAVLGGAWAVVKGRRPLTQTLRFGCFLCGAAALLPLIHGAG